MEPVTVTSSVRRTVRLAVALLVGQALLCALIGWVTLGSSRGDDGRTEGPIVDQLAAPPVAPPVPAPAASTLVPRAVTTTTTTAAPRKAVTRRATTAPAVRPTRPTPAPRRSTPPPPRETAPSPGLINLPPPSPPVIGTPSPSGKVQQPVTVGDRCRPEGAFGRTEDGVEVRCLRSWHRGPRWKIA